MATEEPTTTISTRASDDARGAEIAAMIRSCGWWQGSIIRAEDLRKLDGTLPDGPSYWVMASQTCNLFNRSFEKISTVEWVGVWEVAQGELDTRMKFGRNPRLLQCYVAQQDGSKKWLKCDVQVRHWSPRTCLADAEPQSLRLSDVLQGGWEHQQKDIFIRWLARSYTRLELSDELIGAFNAGGLGKSVQKAVKAKAIVISQAVAAFRIFRVNLSNIVCTTC